MKRGFPQVVFVPAESSDHLSTTSAEPRESQQAVRYGLRPFLLVFTELRSDLFQSFDAETRLVEGCFNPRTFEVLRHGAEGLIHRRSFARVAESWERINANARDVEAYNLDRKPFVFSVFDERGFANCPAMRPTFTTGSAPA